MSKILILEENIFFRELLQNFIQSRFSEMEFKAVLNHEEWLVEMHNFKPHEKRTASGNHSITDENTMSSIKGWLGCSY